MVCLHLLRCFSYCLVSDYISSLGGFLFIVILRTSRRVSAGKIWIPWSWNRDQMLHKSRPVLWPGKTGASMGDWTYFKTEDTGYVGIYLLTFMTPKMGFAVHRRWTQEQAGRKILHWSLGMDFSTHSQSYWRQQASGWMSASWQY